ncbi:MAG TPA: hypothetical protein ENH82_14000 [bacterium]|nr:hypothetical protein [bacterium]
MKINMVNIVFWVYLLLFLLFPHIVETEPAENCVSLDSLQGEWLNKKYIETLQLTKSPRKAVEGIYYTAFTILKDANSYKWGQLYNFHEGIYYNIIELLPTSEFNMYQIQYEPIYEPETPETVERATYTNNFLIYGKPPINEIKWIFKPRYGYPKGEEQRITFVRVEPNIDEYVNRIVLAGTYFDKQGRIFVFSMTGDAEWPDKSYRYQVSLDTVLSDSDYFIVYIISDEEKKRSMIYAFEWQDNTLHIFNIHFPEGGDHIKHDKEPLYILTPR